MSSIGWELHWAGSVSCTTCCIPGGLPPICHRMGTPEISDRYERVSRRDRQRQRQTDTHTPPEGESEERKDDRRNPETLRLCPHSQGLVCRNCGGNLNQEVFEKCGVFPELPDEWGGKERQTLESNPVLLGWPKEDGPSQRRARGPLLPFPGGCSPSFPGAN